MYRCVAAADNAQQDIVSPAGARLMQSLLIHAPEVGFYPGPACICMHVLIILYPETVASLSACNKLALASLLPDGAIPLRPLPFHLTLLT